MEEILLIGAGGHSKSVIEIIQSKNKYSIVGIIDKTNEGNQKVAGIPIIGCDDDLEKFYNKGITNAFITVGSVGNTMVREKLYYKLKEIGFKMPNLIAQSAVAYNAILRGGGVLIGTNCSINNETQIEKMAIINTGAIIEHDCRVGAFSHIAPGCTLCGQVRIGNSTHIGANATIIQNVCIGNNVMVGAGSVVLSDIKDNMRVAGNPAKPI